MALSYVSYTGNGSTTDFNVTFDYISKSHVKVLLNGVESTAFTWLSATQIRMTTAPANGVTVKVKRSTPNTARVVNFTNGSTLNADTDLDTDSNQLFFIAQEAYDNTVDVVAPDGSISTEKLVDGAVTPAKLANFTKTGGTTARSLVNHLGLFLCPEDFGAVGDNVVNDTVALQAAIDAASTSKVSLRMASGKTYRTTAALVLKANLTLDGNNGTINQVTVGVDAMTLSGVSNVWVKQLFVTLPTDAVGTGGAGLRISGVTGWNKFEGVTFSGGRNCIAASGASCFTSTFEKCRFYTTYGSWVRWLDDATSTTISFRNCQGDGVSSTEHAYYFGPVTTGAGIEHLELTMCSADSVSRVAFLRSRYLVVNQFYAERLRGSDWANNFVVFEFGSNFEQPWVHGLKADFSTEVPAALTGLAIVSADGGAFRSCRFGSGFSAYAASTGAVIFRASAGKTLYLESITNNTGCQYGVSAAVHVFGLADARNMALDPASGGTITRPNDLGGVRTAGTNSNSTGGAGVVFGTSDYIVPSGTVSNGAFLAATFAYAALLPFGTGGGTNRQGGMRIFTNPSAAGTTTPVLSTEWEANGDMKLDSHAWNKNRFKLGAYFLWVDGTGKLRIKSSAPASDTDGTVVGTQV